MKGTARNDTPGDWFGRSATNTAEKILAVLNGQAKGEHNMLPRHLVIALHRYALEKVDQHLQELSALSLSSESALQGYEELLENEKQGQSRADGGTGASSGAKRKKRGRPRKQEASPTSTARDAGEEVAAPGPSESEEQDSFSRAE